MEKQKYETPALQIAELHIQSSMLVGSPDQNQAVIPGYGNVIDLN